MVYISFENNLIQGRDSDGTNFWFLLLCFHSLCGIVKATCNYFLEGDLCNKDLENFKAWSFNWTEDLGYDLAPQGYEDLILLAERVKTAFSEALPMPYSEDRYTVSNF